ncbi:MAG TPA: bifunctional protein-serine/threonine kinase/phosphatase [Alphaproteobacteria bacterium]|nr:bifunctional protein-serine/threonine kinase/phosphatase [Alphaproteobacteria bacterium]
MPAGLSISIGQCSEAGRKSANQDFYGALIPEGPLLGLKGVAIVLADGISTSEVGADASETAVKSFLTDYYCTPDSWSVKTSAQRVIAAVNSWMHAQNRPMRLLEDKDRGYVCTLSALVIKSTTAHIFHVGDGRICRVAGRTLEQLTEDHRVIVSSAESYLGRALGINSQIEIDYRSLPVEPGDLFILATDGVHEHVTPRFIAEVVAETPDLDGAARRIVEEAYRQGSSDNLTVQIIRVDAVPRGEAAEVVAHASELPPPPLLEARAEFEGYRIVRELHASSRSHIYLATDEQDGARVAIKIPSIDRRGDPAYMQRFRMEEWVARRINSAHVLRARESSRKRNYAYLVTEFVDGQTLAQWMVDNPRPGLHKVRDIIGQIAKGLQAFHRLEMLHQDLTPANVMIDVTGTAKIIDFGSTSIAGIEGDGAAADRTDIAGSIQYTAPEYFLGEGGTQASDIFSLGVIAYQMLTGRLPYGTAVAKLRTRAQLRKLRYASAVDDHRELPGWVDAVLRKAVHPDPARRYGELSEFLFDLRQPDKAALGIPAAPLLQRNPLVFWQATSALLAAIVVGLLIYLGLRR